MNIQYLTYSSQSGVVQQVITQLARKGANITLKNIGSDILFSRRSALHPNLLLTSLCALQSLHYFKREWAEWLRSPNLSGQKAGELISSFLRVPLAFDIMTRKAAHVIDQGTDADCILQSGVIFSPSYERPKKPFFLSMIDNTYRMGAPFLPRKYEEYEGRVYHFASRIFAMSHNVKRSLMHDYSVPEDRIEVVGVGPNVTPEILGDELNCLKKEPYRIVFIGIWFEQKGGFYLVEAFRRLRKKIPSATLIIIGGTPPIVEDGITVLGQIPPLDVARELCKASLFVLPSIREPFGIAFLDAMSFGLPCIGTNVEAIPEIIDNGYTGFLVPPADANALAEKMYEVLENKSAASSMGDAGRIKVNRQFNWQIIGDRIFSILEKHL
ncbi:MAG TPA: glycosyltransferase family 4 protein [Syntrophorhabdaceae bacterium]